MDELITPPVVQIGDFKALKWQGRALDVFKKKISGNEHQNTNFTICAAPNSGKTKFAGLALKTAQDLFDIELAIVLAPTTIIKGQWSREIMEFKINLSTEYNNKLLSKNKKLDPTLDGFVITYSQLARFPDLFRKYSFKYNSMVIFDEVHHLGDEKTWGEAARYSFEYANIRMSLSGTPFRSDGNAIPFQEYEENEN